MLQKHERPTAPIINLVSDHSEATAATKPSPSSSLPTVAALTLPRYYYPPMNANNNNNVTADPASSCLIPSKHILSSEDIAISKKRKELFGDCALIEIIHLHDCLRGALKALHEDVTALTQQIIQNFHSQQDNDSSPASTTATEYQAKSPHSDAAVVYETEGDCVDLERRVAGRFKVIWSVFRAHSSAEDEFIWPALRSKMYNSTKATQPPDAIVRPPNAKIAKNGAPVSTCGCGAVTTGLVQEEYEEDHADEERMFSEMNDLLRRLRGIIHSNDVAHTIITPNHPSEDDANEVARKISERTRVLSDHLMRHLEKEETQCMPLVLKHLSKSEIHDLVGNIMGKRSADTIAQIMTMAVQSLSENERQEMILYMKQSMQNTFFDRWLKASGWGTASCNVAQSTRVPEQERKCTALPTLASTDQNNETLKDKRTAKEEQQASVAKKARTLSSGSLHSNAQQNRISSGDSIVAPTRKDSNSSSPRIRPIQITSQAELEKLIRAIATNPALTPQQKNSTIQSLRDSVWKSNQRESMRRQKVDSPPVVAVNDPVPGACVLPFLHQQNPSTICTTNNEVQKRRLPPAAYYKKTGDSRVELVWKNDTPLRSGVSTTDPLVNGLVPLFSASELAPTYHDGAAGTALGCPHYARACKLRHPTSGRLYTCRLCCDQARELPAIRGGSPDEKLDRYAVTEVMCMNCNALQPAEDCCIHPDCESYGKPFAKYFCRICHLYDGGTRPIFHCPYCNICRLGQGLGIDFRHCMRCNACVSLDDKDHQCIPQKLQGKCPICRDTLFQSTEPLRGLKCGHVMHMTCFTQYRRTSYTCPLCMRSMEDMKDHFALLDTAIRMQPMPANFLFTMSNIYCQDCCKTGQVQYHFVGQKCPSCGSYNTREMGRVHGTPTNS